MISMFVHLSIYTLALQLSLPNNVWYRKGAILLGPLIGDISRFMNRMIIPYLLSN